MISTSEPKSRRCFVQYAARLGVALYSSTLAVHGQEEADAFDSLPKSVWGNARRNGLVMIHRPAPALLSDRTQMVRADEPGQPLVITGQVIASDGRTPVEGIIVYTYQTDSAGYYGSDHKEYPPRLYGWMKTDAGGHFELYTVYPGHYPGMRVPAHVHFTLWGKGYPPQWAEELRFEGDRYLTPEMRAEAAGQGEFSSIRPLTQKEDGILQCRYKMRMLTETNFH